MRQCIYKQKKCVLSKRLASIEENSIEEKRLELSEQERIQKFKEIKSKVMSNFSR